MIRIGIVGPESTGKTVLTNQLASKFKGDVVPEFAREYLEKKVKYDQGDLLNIAIGQYNRILSHTKGIVFIDTELLVIKIWSVVKYGECSKEIERLVSSLKIDLYLLTYPDIDWKDDPLRESGGHLMDLFVRYEDELKSSEVPFRIVTGKGELRLENAVEAVNNFLLAHCL